MYVVIKNAKQNDNNTKMIKYINFFKDIVLQWHQIM